MSDLATARKVEFFVQGDPKPAGSKRGFAIFNKATKKHRAIIVDANPNSKDWKADVRSTALAAYKGELMTDALTVAFTFYKLRPKSHYRTGKNASLLRNDAPKSPVFKPDVLKLARAVEDALTGIVYKDDCQIVNEYLQKRWGEKPGVLVAVIEDA